MLPHRGHFRFLNLIVDFAASISYSAPRRALGAFFFAHFGSGPFSFLEASGGAFVSCLVFSSLGFSFGFSAFGAASAFFASCSFTSFRSSSGRFLSLNVLGHDSQSARLIVVDLNLAHCFLRPRLCFNVNYVDGLWLSRHISMPPLFSSLFSTGCLFDHGQLPHGSPFSSKVRCILLV